jgi:ribA/ribD-fused uncharacterized protein
MGKTCVYFYGRSSPFSKHHVSPFVVKGEKYACVEQFIVAEKARLFGDDDILALVMKEKTPAGLQHLEREIRDYDHEVWKKKRFGVACRGLIAKFGQDQELFAKLMETGDKHVAEANPWDRVWGVGLGAVRASRGEPWRGKNLLGKAVMTARRLLRERRAAERKARRAVR